MAVDDSYSVALLHFDGADASPTITDESGKSWTAQGTAQIDTAQSVFGGASLLLDGNSDYVDTADSADWQLDGGSNSNAWTIDVRIRFSADPGTDVTPIVQQYGNTSNYWSLFIAVNNLSFSVYSAGSQIIRIDNAFNPAADTWYHIAIVKDGANGYLMFVDGTQIGSTQTDTSTIPDISGTLLVGKLTSAASNVYYHNGWIDELRISKGIARWTANFTPPTREYGGGGQVIIWSE